MTKDEEFARAVWNVANQEGFDITGPKTPVPRGFWIKVVKELGDATNSEGKPWTTTNASVKWDRHRDKLVKLIDPTHNVVQLGKSFPDEDRVREIFQEELAVVKQVILDAVDERLKFLQDVGGRNAIGGVDEPPLAPKLGRKSQGKVKHISVRVDKVLYDEFAKTCQEKWKVDQGRGLDIILWNFLGKPDLSFQKSGKE